MPTPSEEADPKALDHRTADSSATSGSGDGDGLTGVIISNYRLHKSLLQPLLRPWSVPPTTILCGRWTRTG
ncbi:hypothetical protein POX_e06918 [Penicillium oxalicum]|uniref:Uncharacterized protein n=1 Tax=Penicillium oxalicum (strain 114-2 / CGMCC 5302) TaxID=933388 RepID=S7ZCF6_PENO1|nr:hypothetical protein POX_e06918 [Penicillium oxalicum]EPS27944.1 hypothetical protein PDE_02888 [Penicillium oxalicum 114-2]KAI2788894.1 hypothetical protein POX_e06918 [Penicillium oxalicum]